MFIPAEKDETNPGNPSSETSIAKARDEWLSEASKTSNKDAAPLKSGHSSAETGKESISASGQKEPDFLDLTNVFASETPTYKIPDAAQEQNLKAAKNKGVDAADNHVFEYENGSMVSLSKDGSGFVRYPADKKTAIIQESHFGPKADQNYNITISIIPDKGWSYDYSDGRFAHINKDGQSGFERRPINLTQPKDAYTEKHWGPKPEDKYSIAVIKNTDDSKIKTYDNGKIVIENQAGFDISGYETTKQGGLTTERHWGPHDKDWYYKRVQADGGIKIESIPRNYDSMLDIRGASVEFTARVKATLDQFPRLLMEDLKAKGTKIVLARNIQNYDNQLANTPIRGQSGSYSTSEGMYLPDKNSVLLMETHIFQGRSVFAYRPERILAHELGHAWDYQNGFPSHSEVFDKAFKQDLEKLSPQDKQEYAYLTANAHDPNEYFVRREETLGELLPAVLVNKTSGEWGASKLGKNFPHSYAAVADLVQQRHFVRDLAQRVSPDDIAAKVAER